MTLSVFWKSSVTTPAFKAKLAVIQKTLSTASKDVSPVVTSFSKALRASIKRDFIEGGRPPYKWAANKPNTIAAKGHARPLVGKGGGVTGKLEKAIRIENVYAPPRRYGIEVHVPTIGAYHMAGWSGGTIKPKTKKFLRFPVAEDHKDYRARRARAVARRKAGQNARIPSRPGVKWVFAKVVHHKGYPARKFVVVRESLIARYWRRPMREFLFEGKVPS